MKVFEQKHGVQEVLSVEEKRWQRRMSKTIKKKHGTSQMELYIKAFGNKTVILQNLHRSCMHRNIPLTKKLIDSKADVNQPVRGGWTPLHFACESMNRRAAILLLKAKALPSAVSITGDTPLHIAASKGNAALVQLLLVHKADPIAEDNRGNLPINHTAWSWALRSRHHMAEFGGYSEVIDYLIGSHPNAPDCNMAAKRAQLSSLVRMQQMRAATQVIKRQVKEQDRIAELLTNHGLTKKIKYDFGILLPGPVDNRTRRSVDKGLADRESAETSSIKSLLFKLEAYAQTSRTVDDKGFKIIDTMDDMVKRGAHQLFVLPLVREFFKDIWMRQVRWIHYVLMGLHLLFLCCITTLAVTIHSSFDGLQTLQIVMEGMVLVISCLQVCIVAKSAWSIGLKRYFLTYIGITNLEIIEVLVALPTSIFHLTLLANDKPIERAVNAGLAYTNLVAWLRLGLFLFPIKWLRHNIILVASMANAFNQFLFVFIISLAGFSVLFSSLFRNTDRFHDIDATMMELYLFACGSMDNYSAITEELGEKYELLFPMMFMIFSGVNSLGLGNWLIAIMVTQFTSVQAHSEAAGEYWHSLYIIKLQALVKSKGELNMQPKIVVVKNQQDGKIHSINKIGLESKETKLQEMKIRFANRLNKQREMAKRLVGACGIQDDASSLMLGSRKSIRANFMRKTPAFH